MQALLCFAVTLLMKKLVHYTIRTFHYMKVSFHDNCVRRL